MKNIQKIKQDIATTHHQYWPTFSTEEQLASVQLRRLVDSTFPSNSKQVTGPDARKNYIEVGVSNFAKKNTLAAAALALFVQNNNVKVTTTTKWTRYHIYRDSLPVPTATSRKARTDRAFQTQTLFDAAYDIANNSSVTIKERTASINFLLTKPLSEKVVGRLCLYAQSKGSQQVDDFYTWQRDYIKSHQKPKMSRDEKLEEITDFLGTKPSLINRIYKAIFG